MIRLIGLVLLFATVISSWVNPTVLPHNLPILPITSMSLFCVIAMVKVLVKNSLIFQEWHGMQNIVMPNMANAQNTKHKHG